MKKHQRRKLWQRMGLRFRADRVIREKKKELEFRAILAAKVTFLELLFVLTRTSDILYTDSLLACECDPPVF